jgi:DNA-binding transcriptional ArsR family regulator
MSAPRAVAVTFLLMFLAGSSAAAPGGEPFRLVATSHSSLSLDGIDQVEGHDMAFTARSSGAHGSASPMSIRGEAVSVSIVRHETQWTLADVGGLPTLGSPGGPSENATPTNYSNVQFEYDSVDPSASAVLWLESARLNLSTPQLKLASAIRDPVLVTDGPRREHGSAFNPDERGRWVETGDHLLWAHPGFEGTGEGGTRLYVSRGSIELRTPQGPVTLESRAWTEDVEPSGSVRIRHVVWHDLRAGDARVSFSVAPPSSTLNSVLLGRSFAAPDVEAFSMDSHTALNGTIPASGRSAGSSLWVHGSMQTEVRARPAGPQAPSYTLTAEGQADAYAYGGSLPRAIGTVAVASGVILLPALVYALRELLIYALSRSGLPLYTRLAKQEVLNLRTREVIFQTIQSSPGINFLALRQRVPSVRGPGPIAFGILAHHLAKLEGFGLVLSRREGRYRRYFDAGSGLARDAAAIALLKTAPVNHLARIILERPGSTVNELRAHLAGSVALQRTSVLHHLDRLMNHGLVARERRGKFSTYSPTERLRSVAALATADLGWGRAAALGSALVDAAT